MKRIKRWSIRIGIALVTLAIIVASVGTWFVRRPWPEVSGTLQVAGLSAPVEVLRDRWGVPNIYAQNEHDLFFAQGYVHAQDQLWKMETNRRLASGRLSEILGSGSLETDRFIRAIGLRRIAEQSWPQLDEDSRTILNAYAEGVNAYIDTHRDRLSIEFTIMGIQPEPWTPIDTLVWGNLMAIYGSHNFTMEIARAELIAKDGEEAAKRFFAPYAKDTPFIISGAAGGQETPNVRVPPEVRNYAWMRDIQRPETGQTNAWLPREPMASNSWVVHGSRSQTGTPILANDPHSVFLMSFYENGLHGGRFDTVGFTFPGVPLVIIGHNSHIAWGLTIFNADVQDAYVEKLDNNERPTQYEFMGQWYPLEVAQETIEVKGSAPDRLNILSTRHGPILSTLKTWFGEPLLMTTSAGEPISLRWSLQGGSVTFRSIVQLSLATNWKEFQAALQYWDTVGQNFVYADRDGNIGFLATGKLPIRAPGHEGILPVPGWTGTYEWQGFIPPDQLPAVLNPPSDLIVTANNKVISNDYPHFLTYEDEPGYRAKRITNLLSTGKPLTIGDMQAIHADTYSIPAELLRPYLLALTPEDERQAQALDALKRWDLNDTADSVGASIFETWYYFLMRNMIAKRYGEGFLYQLHYLELVKICPMLIESLAEPDNPWLDDKRTPERETRDHLVRQSLADALTWLSERYGADSRKWRWGDIHTASFAHFPLGYSGIGVVEKLVNSQAVPMPGSLFSVNASTYPIGDPFKAIYGVRLRMIADAGNWDSAVAVVAPGQSGHLFHPQRMDQIAPWQSVEYHPMPFSRKAVEENAEATLTLSP